jgi:hypothetical protein
MRATFGIIPAAIPGYEQNKEAGMRGSDHGAAVRRAMLGALLVAAAGCAPDAVRRDDAFDAWVTRVGKACYPKRIGHAMVDERLGKDGMFLDLTSRVYHKQISWQQYASSVDTRAPGDNEAALRCIRENLPQ